MPATGAFRGRSSRAIALALVGIVAGAFPLAPSASAVPVDTIYTVMGSGPASGTAVAPVDGTRGTDVVLWTPKDVATGPDGAVFVVDRKFGRVLRLDPTTGTVSTYAGTTNTGGSSGDGGPATAAKLPNPDHLAIDADGDVYVNAVGVWRIDHTTKVITKVSTLTSNGIAAEASGTLAQGVGHDLYRLDPTTKASTFLSHVIPEADQAAIFDLAVAPNGKIYALVHGFVAYTLLRFDPVTGAREVVLPSGTSPTLQRISVGTDGALVASMSDDTIRRYDTTTWSYTTIGGTPGSPGFSGDGGPATDAQMSGPTSVEARPDGSIAVTDEGNERVRIIGGSGPFSPGAPGAPTLAGSARALDRAATVSWTAPTSDGGSPITSFTITPYLDNVAGAPISVAAGARSGVVAGLANGTAYTFRVHAVNADGTGPPSAFTTAVTPQRWLPWSSTTAAVDDVFAWMTGTGPTVTQRGTWRDAVDAGSKEVADLVVALRDGSDATEHVDPVARLYSAYFLRIPDADGLTYWITRRRAGARLESISGTFAGSHEFKTRYGSLSNKAFVELVYQNVLGRPGDPGGVDYWTKQLDLKRKTRGVVMVGFSESNEYRTKQVDKVDAAVLYIQILGRPPTPAERDAFVAARLASIPLASLVHDLLRAPELAVGAG